VGHVVDRARRWERPIAYESAAVAGGRLTVAYVAQEVNQFWRPLRKQRRVAALPLAQFANAALSADAVELQRLPDDAAPAGAPVRVSMEAGPGEPRLLAAGPEPDALYLDPAVLTRAWVEPWVWPLLPVLAVWDAATVPVLAFFAPAVVIPGD
jgi:hypothetical protein